jgi:hypothetical protein
MSDWQMSFSNSSSLAFSSSCAISHQKQLDIGNGTVNALLGCHFESFQRGRSIDRLQLCFLPISLSIVLAGPPFVGFTPGRESQDADPEVFLTDASRE